MLSSNSATCGKKKSAFVKNKELYNFNAQFKKNGIIKKILSTGDRFMAELETFFGNQNLLTVLVGHLANIVKDF